MLTHLIRRHCLSPRLFSTTFTVLLLLLHLVVVVFSSARSSSCSPSLSHSATDAVSTPAPPVGTPTPTTTTTTHPTLTSLFTSLSDRATAAARAVSMFAACRQPAMVSKDKALPGRDEEMKISDKHFVLGNPMKPPFPDNMEQVVVATGCFWGTERLFYKRLPGVYTTAVGYINGFTKNPTYKEVCTGRTGHTEAVLVVFDPAKASFADLLKIFWESHNPTHGFRQGPDVGTQYRSGIYCTTDKQMRLAEASKKAYQAKLDGKAITTEIVACPTFYYAEDYHQQYLDKPGNRQYCGAAPTGEALPPPLEWDLSDEDKASTSTNPDVWSKVWAGCVFGE